MDYSSNYDITVPINAQCNLDCVFCMLRRVIKRKSFTQWRMSLKEFQSLIHDLQITCKYRRLIISGAEPTLHPQIIFFLKFASDYFQKIQIQTNGILLSDRKFAKKVAFYCKEFFITVMGGKASIHNSAVNSQLAFKSLLKAIDNLHDLGTTIISNTVITSLNYKNLPSLVAFLYKSRIRDIHFWVFNSFGNDRKKYLMPNAYRAKPFLEEAILFCRRHKISVVVKWFPKCTLDPKLRRIVNNAQPALIRNNLIRGLFDPPDVLSFQCRFEKICKEYSSCQGLTREYINKYGYKGICPIR